MPKRALYEDDFDYDDEDYEDNKRGVRRLKQLPESYESRKKQDQERTIDRGHELPPAAK